MLLKYIYRYMLLLPLLIAFSCQQYQDNTASNAKEDGSDPADQKLTFKEVQEQDSDTNASAEKQVSGISISVDDISAEEMEARRESRQYFNAGVRKLKQKQYTESIEDFDKVLELSPENSKALYNRGLAHYHLEMYNEARFDFENSAKLNPEDSSSFLYLGMMKYFRNDFHGAIVEYDKTIERAPYYSNAYYNRGLAKGRLFDLNGAIEDFDRALEIDPDNKEYYFNRGLAIFLTGDTLQACKNWNDAKALGSSEAIEAIQYYCEDK
jgi:tetratricopeptide (TPR) repeat protein